MTNSRIPAVKDHKGNKYLSLTEMCAAYGIQKETYINRIISGMSQEDALTTPVELSARNDVLATCALNMFLLRTKLKLTQDDFGQYLADLVGYAKPYTFMMISGIENARKCFDMPVYIALARDQGISLDYLFGATNDPAPYDSVVRYKTLAERVKAVLPKDLADEGIDLRNTSTQKMVELAFEMKVPLDYLVGMTDETVIHANKDNPEAEEARQLIDYFENI